MPLEEWHWHKTTLAVLKIFIYCFSIRFREVLPEYSMLLWGKAWPVLSSNIFLLSPEAYYINVLDGALFPFLCSAVLSRLRKMSVSQILLWKSWGQTMLHFQVVPSLIFLLLIFLFSSFTPSATFYRDKNATRERIKKKRLSEVFKVTETLLRKNVTKGKRERRQWNKWHRCEKSMSMYKSVLIKLIRFS